MQFYASQVYGISISFLYNSRLFVYQMMDNILLNWFEQILSGGGDLGWLVKIKSIQDADTGKKLVGSFMIWCNP